MKEDVATTPRSLSGKRMGRRQLTPRRRRDHVPRRNFRFHGAVADRAPAATEASTARRRSLPPTGPNELVAVRIDRCGFGRRPPHASRRRDIAFETQKADGSFGRPQLFSSSQKRVRRTPRSRELRSRTETPDNRRPRGRTVGRFVVRSYVIHIASYAELNGSSTMTAKP